MRALRRGHSGPAIARTWTALALAAEQSASHSAGREAPPACCSRRCASAREELRPLPAGIAGYRAQTDPPRPIARRLCRALSVQLQREKKAPRRAGARSRPRPTRLPLRLLLADDNPINQKVGLSVLHKLGYRADVANNGLEVLKALDQKAYDILFLDVQMPEMDGLEAARQICQRWPADKRPRIIAMTGNALMGDREKCLQAGMDDYISKPVRVRELQTALERWAPANSRLMGKRASSPAVRAHLMTFWI